MCRLYSACAASWWNMLLPTPGGPCSDSTSGRGGSGAARWSQMASPIWLSASSCPTIRDARKGSSRSQAPGAKLRLPAGTRRPREERPAVGRRGRRGRARQRAPRVPAGASSPGQRLLAGTACLSTRFKHARKQCRVVPRQQQPYLRPDGGEYFALTTEQADKGAHCRHRHRPAHGKRHGGRLASPTSF